MKSTRAAIIRDIGVAILLLWAFFQALALMMAPKDAQLTYIILLIVMDILVLVGFSGRVSISTVLSSTLTCAWVSYKLYCFYALGEVIHVTDYIMAPLPLVGAAACALFQHGLKGIDLENTILRYQVEELVLVDEITGLYNQRALYRDMGGSIRYAIRNGLPISLMIVQPRYEAELRGMLSKRQYTELRQLMANIVSNTVRVEDRVYSVDDKCTLAIVLTADDEGSRLVRGRLKSALQAEGAFPGIMNRGTKLDVRFASKMYDRDRFGENMMAFKTAVESELVYDV